MSVLEKTILFLGCPNDSKPIKIFQDKLVCEFCQNEFKIINENTIELLPSKSFKLRIENNTTKSYSEYYSDLLTVGHSRDSKKRLWGTKTKTIPKGFVDKLLTLVSNAVGNEIVCDIGAGSGDYSLILAKNSKYVFHCDLDLEAILFARAQAENLELNNILFIRCNYFYLPFRDDSLPFITCIDVLLRGREHDDSLIKEIFKKLQINGKALLDFHSKERIKINKSIDPDGCYSKNEIFSILSRFNFKVTFISGMGFAPTINKLPKTLYTLTNFSFKKILPPARWIVKVIKVKKQ